MPTPGELTARVADALSIPTTAVISYDRYLLDAGLRSKSGRGNAAPKVTARDATHLLTAVLGSGQIKDSAQTIQRYAETRCSPTTSSAGAFLKLGIQELSALPEEASFLDALEALIVATASGSLLAAVWKDEAPPPPLREIAPLIEVAAQTPGTVGEIRIAGLHNRRTAHVIYALPEAAGSGRTKPSTAELEAWAAKVARYRLNTDLTQQRRVTAHTIIRVAELFEPELRKAG